MKLVVKIGLETDGGRENFYYILDNEIEPIENLTTEETNDDCI